MTTPTDQAGEKFDEAVAEAFDRDCMRENVFRDEEHEHDVAQSAIRQSAEALAAERVKEALERILKPANDEIAKLENEAQNLYSGGDDDWEDRARAIISQKLSLTRRYRHLVEAELAQLEANQPISKDDQ